jgi:ATP-dependent phosphoenolpyruvate carboxykinase
LNEDGVVPAGVNAFRNARTPILFSKLGVKAAESVDVKFKLDGSAAILEAGDSISQEDFKGLLHEATEYLSSGIDLFVEDAVVGSHQQHQLGVRVITEQAVQALVARTALVSYFPLRLQ